MRTPKLAGYAFDFMRMNRRMHNKSYIVDGAVTIIGGRNIGDEYFQVGDENYFLDLDVLSVGSVVAETAGSSIVTGTARRCSALSRLSGAKAIFLPS